MADELSNWLRRMRPPTDADDGWADTPDGDDALNAIHHRITRAHKARRARRWMLLPAVAVAGSAAAVLVASAVSTPITETNSHPPTPVPNIALRPAAKLLTPFNSCAALLNGLRSHAASHINAFTGGYGGMYSNGALTAAGAPVPAEAKAGDSASAGSGSGQTSTTNVQEKGVDEPDIVKTDGGRVITVTGGKLHVIDASTHAITGTIDLTLYSGWQGAQLLASGDHAIVMLDDSNVVYPVDRGPVNGGGVAAPYSSPQPTGTARTNVLYVDLAGKPTVTGTMQVDGQVLDARMVGSTVRLVVSSRPTMPPIEYGNNGQPSASSRNALGKAPLTDWLPTYTVANATHAVPCTDVSHPVDYTAASMVTIYTLDPARPGADPQPVTLAADGGTVYASQSSLYVASNPNCVWCPGVSTQSSQTQIHRFDITGTGKPTYLGSGSVQGSLLSQYSLSDYDNHLRVATTTYAPSSSKQTNGVTVLDDDTLKVTGAVSGLGNGERLYAVRFLGPLGYVVTFNQIDPLYVLDLSDPDNPHAVGSLELNGFSSYLHDVGSGRLLGVGQDTTPVNEGGGVYAHIDGLLVQLFDVHNPSKPTRTSHITLSNTPGQVQFDPHAFLYWAPTGLVAVPVGTWSEQDMGKVLVARVVGSSLVQVGLVGNDGSVPASSIERSMIVDGSLWTFSASGIRVSNEKSLAQQAWISLA